MSEVNPADVNNPLSTIHCPSCNSGTFRTHGNDAPGRKHSMRVECTSCEWMQYFHIMPDRSAQPMASPGMPSIKFTKSTARIARCKIKACGLVAGEGGLCRPHFVMWTVSKHDDRHAWIETQSQRELVDQERCKNLRYDNDGNVIQKIKRRK